MELADEFVVELVVLVVDVVVDVAVDKYRSFAKVGEKRAEYEGLADGVRLTSPCRSCEIGETYRVTKAFPDCGRYIESSLHRSGVT